MYDHVRVYHKKYFEEHRKRKGFKRKRPQTSLSPQSFVSTTGPSPLASMECQASRVAPDTLEPDDFDVGAAVGLDDEEPPAMSAAGEEPPAMSAAGFPILTSSSSIEACRSEATREFFFRDQTNGDGMKYLAARAQFGMTNILPANLNMMETKMMMQTAELASSLPKRTMLLDWPTTPILCAR
jgi:hypothetical protein